MHVKDLAVYLHHSCVDASGSPAQSPHRAARQMKPGFRGLICPILAEQCSSRVGSGRWRSCVGPRGAGQSCPQRWVGPALLSRGVRLLLPSAWSLRGACSWGWAGIHLASEGILSNTSLSSNCFWMSYRSQRRNGALGGAARGSASIWGTI